MGQRQFRSTDSDRWLHGFGQKGNIVTVSADAVLQNYYDTLSGLEGQQPALPIFDDGDILVVHNSRGPEANNSVTWELNRKFGGQCQYPLTRDYSNTGNSKSQVVKALVCRKFILTGGSLSLPAWNTVSGQGGLGVIIADEVDLRGGTVDLRLAGFLAGPTGGDYAGGIAENWLAPAKGPYESPGGRDTSFRSAVGNAGGSASGNNTDGVTQPGAGGPGHSAPGNNGATGTAIVSPFGYGLGGGESGNPELSGIVFGGAGSVGAGHVDGGGWYPGSAAGRGTGSLIVICRKFYAPLRIICDGSDAAPLPHSQTGGSSGSTGGNVLIQGQEIDLGSGVITALHGTSATRAGTPADGRIAVRYSRSITGSTSPAANVTQDDIYRHFSKSQALPFLL